MSGRQELVRSALAAALLLMLPLAWTPSQDLAAQQAADRFRVLVTDVWPSGDLDEDFGEELAKELRDRINDLATPQPVDEDDVRRALRSLDVDEDELQGCVQLRQLARHLEAPVVLCGTYSRDAGGGYQVAVRFVQTDSGEEFVVDPFVVGEEEYSEAAERIYSAFDTYVQQLRYTQFCGDYLQSQVWESALENCDQAIALNPQSIAARFNRAQALLNLERHEEALEEVKRVLEMNEIHENALRTGGFLAATLDRPEEAREYYNRYLELQPTDAQVRMHVAYDLASAGDPLGAMQLIEDGIELDSANIDLWEQYGNFAMSAAAGAREGGQEGELTAEAVELYRKALGAYDRVVDARGEESKPGTLRSMVAAAMQLKDFERAAAIGERAIGLHPEESPLWSIYADALQRCGQLDQALAALDSLKARDPEYANLASRQGKWLLDEGRVNDALPYLREAVEGGEQSGDGAARMIIRYGQLEAIQKSNWGLGERIFPLALEFAEGEMERAMASFFLGYSIYQRAVAEQEPQTLETAEATLPRFRRALELFQASRPFTDTQEGVDLQQFLEAATQYIDIQTAIIKRGR